MLNQSQAVDILSRPITHRNPNPKNSSNSLLTGLTIKSPEHLSVSQRNLKNQIKSISRASPRTKTTSNPFFAMKQSVYFSDALSHLKNSNGPIKKQPLINRVMKLQRNDEYFMNKLPQKKASLLKEQHEKCIQALQNHRFRKQSFRDIQDMIQQIGHINEHINQEQEILMLSSRVSIINLLRESRQKSQNCLEKLFQKCHVRFTKRFIRQLVCELKRIKSVQRLSKEINQMVLKRKTLAFLALSHMNHVTANTCIQHLLIQSNSQQIKLLNRCFYKRYKMQLLRWFYMFRLKLASQ